MKKNRLRSFFRIPLISFYFVRIFLVCQLLSNVLGNSESFGQGSSEAPFPQVNIISPTASAIAKYVDFPVNQHTGVPEIQIPIYTVQEGPLQLPITLSYHASGLPVMEPASWVGSGWSINAGGVISRTVRNRADEQVVQEDWSFYGYGGFSNYFLDVEGLIDFNYFVNGFKDGEPDLFTYNFGNYSGKFYFREDLTPVLIPEGDVKIEAVTKPGLPSFSKLDYIQGFKATAPDGVKYYFGITPQTDDVDPVDRSTAASATSWPSYPKVVSSWYLYKIESADNQFSINLSYRKEDYSYFTISTKPCIPDCNFTILPAKIVMYGVALEKIQFTNGLVEFFATGLRQDVGGKSGAMMDDANIEARTLDAIRISSSHSQNCKSFNFSYDYFVDNFNNPLPYVLATTGINFVNDRKRLKLLSLEESSCDGTTSTPPYVFHYYDEDLVPRRLNLGQDHWGFYNGVKTNANLIPAVSINSGATYYLGDDRESRWPEMRAGALRLIQYPTGGITEYVYEPNSVAITGNCTFSSTNAVVTTLSAGMGGPVAGFGLPYTLVVTTPTAFFYRLQSLSGGSGSLYVDNSIVASVSSGEREDYILLPPGTYSLRAFANADNGSGVGVLATVFSATASCPPSLEKVVGGLRIKQINKSPGKDSPKLSMSYEYQDANLYSIPVYVFKLRNEIFKLGWKIVDHGTEEGCIAFVENGTKYRTFFSPSSLQPLQTVQGYHIGYRKVKEKHADGGYTMYEFKGNLALPGGWYTMEDVCVRKIDETVCNLNDPVYPAAPIPYDFERGHLKSKRVFDNTNYKLSEALYSEEYVENQVGVFGIAVTSFPDDDGAPYLSTNYQLRSGRQNWTKQIERNFDRNGSATETERITYFNSPFHRMPSRKTESTTSGTSRIDLTYVPDLTQCNYSCPSCSADYIATVNTLLTEYLAKDDYCKLGICSNASFVGWRNIELERPCYVFQGELVNCRKAAWVDYQYRLNQARVAYTSCIKNCTQNNTCISNGVSNNTNGAVKALYILEQQNQLQLIESSLWKDNVFQFGKYYNYEPDVGDATKVYLKNILSTEVSTPLTNFTPASIAGEAIQKDAKYSNYPIVTFRFSGGQPVEVNERSGLTTSYIWDFNNTVPIVKAVGAEFTALQTAFNSSPTDFRNDISLSKAQVTSYTYDPIVGITSITDANGRVLYYEYDKLGRLVRVKDHDGKVLEETEYTYRIE